MKDGGATLALLGRAVVSLLLITGLILVAYMVIRRYRTRAGRMPAKAARPATRGTAGRPGRRPSRQQLTVLSRISTSRTSSITAVQFGDRVLLVGTNEQSTANVLAEMPLREWDVIDAQEIPSLTGVQGVDPQRLTTGATGLPSANEGRTPVGQFLEALRTATARHA